MKAANKYVFIILLVLNLILSDWQILKQDKNMGKWAFLFTVGRSKNWYDLSTKAICIKFGNMYQKFKWYTFTQQSV